MHSTLPKFTNRVRLPMTTHTLDCVHTPPAPSARKLPGCRLAVFVLHNRTRSLVQPQAPDTKRYHLARLITNIHGHAHTKPDGDRRAPTAAGELSFRSIRSQNPFHEWRVTRTRAHRTAHRMGCSTVMSRSWGAGGGRFWAGPRV